MCVQPRSEDDRSYILKTPKSRWRVKHVTVLKNYRLQVSFLDGTAGIVDMAALVASPSAGVFADLIDPERFAAAQVDFGVVTWPGGIDLAPDAMYQAIRSDGQWVVAAKA